MLGTNDAKPQNWQATEYQADYASLIAYYRGLGANVVIMVPPPVYNNGAFDISPAVVNEQLRQIVPQIAAAANTPLIDLHQPLANHPEWFPDNVHPNADGARALAEVVAMTVVTVPPGPSNGSVGESGSGGGGASGTSGASGATASGGSPGPGTGGSAGATAAAGGSTAGTGVGPDATGGMTAPVSAPSAQDDAGGCAIHPGLPPSSGAVWPWLLGMLLAARGRRQLHARLRS